MPNFGVTDADGCAHVGYRVVEEPVGTDSFADLGDRVIRSDEFGGGGEIDAVRIGTDNWW